MPYLLDSEVADVVMLLQIAVQGDAVALMQQVLCVVDLPHTQGPLYPVVQVGVKKNYGLESEVLGLNPKCLPGVTKADKAQCLIMDSDATGATPQICSMLCILVPSPSTWYRWVLPI